MKSTDYFQRALRSDRLAFVTAFPHFFFLGRGALHRPSRPDATVQMSSFDDAVTTITRAPWGKERLEPHAEEPTWQVLPLIKTQPFHPDMITIGRTANNDVVLQDVTVSKFHAYVRVPSGGLHLDAGGVDLSDAQSNNGTFVARHRLDPTVAIFVPTGSSVRFGSVSLTILDAGRLWEAIQTERSS